MEGSFCGVPMSPSAADRAAAAGSSSFALWTPPESPPAPPLAGHGAATSAGLMGGNCRGPEAHWHFRWSHRHPSLSCGMIGLLPGYPAVVWDHTGENHPGVHVAAE